MHTTTFYKKKKSIISYSVNFTQISLFLVIVLITPALVLCCVLNFLLILTEKNCFHAENWISDCFH